MVIKGKDCQWWWLFDRKPFSLVYSCSSVLLSIIHEQSWHLLIVRSWEFIRPNTFQLQMLLTLQRNAKIGETTKPKVGTYIAIYCTLWSYYWNKMYQDQGSFRVLLCHAFCICLVMIQAKVEWWQGRKYELDH